MVLRKVTPDLVWQIFLLRGLGLSESEIASRLSSKGLLFRQETISYHLRRLRARATFGNEYRVLSSLISGSDSARRDLLQVALSGAAPTQEAEGV